MRVFLALALISVCVAASPLDDWLSFKATHGKRYSNPSEERYRLNVFLENKAKIQEHNEKFQQGLETFHMKMNQFGDLTEEEFQEMLHPMEAPRHPETSLFSAPANAAIPDSVDWRQKGAVTAVKNQGRCGSCWAFSTTGSLEGQTFLKKGKLVSLSEQNLVDCSKSNNGCGGGLMENAFHDIRRMGGIDTEDSYPYEGVKSRCRFNPSKVGAKVLGYRALPAKDEAALKAAIATVGPVSVAINAGQPRFRFYSGGVYSDSGCRAALNHGVLAVGYGTQDGQDYWLVKNSWGTKWGDHGYIKMARNKNNQCGISSMAGYPLI